MQRLRWMLVLFLLGAAVCCCAIPGVDLPETSFNEADLPVNLALPAQPRIPDIPPVLIPATALPALSLYCEDCVARSFAHETSYPAKRTPSALSAGSPLHVSDLKHIYRTQSLTELVWPSGLTLFGNLRASYDLHLPRATFV